MQAEADGEGEPMWCSNVACQKRWSSDAPLALAPVIEAYGHGERIWHPCPACMENYGPVAELAHALRAQTARELSVFG